MESKNSKLNFTNLIEELQGKFDRVFEYVQSLKSENESLKHKIESLETEIEKLKRENEELRKNGVVLFSEASLPFAFHTCTSHNPSTCKQAD